MKALIIDSPENLEFSQKLQKEFKESTHCDICDLPSSDKSPREIAEEININYTNLLSTQETPRDPFWLLINIEGKYGRSNRQEQNGAEILMWLRCKYLIANPVIFFGFQSNCELLKQKPEHLLINSKGCYYYRLPYDFRNIIKQPFEGLVKNDWNELKKFLKPMINLEQIKHSSANRIGMIRMNKVLYKYYNPLENLNKKMLNYEDSLEYTLLKFIFGYEKEFEISDSLKKEIKSKKEKIKNFKPIVLYIDDMGNKGWGNIFCHLINDCKESKSENRFKSISDIPSKDKDLILKVSGEIQTIKPHIILLDLRLKNEKGQVNIEDLGGYKILREVKKEFMGLPVIITSATNKGQNIKLLFEAGADFVWTKPGFDDISMNDEIIDRFMDLLNSIYSALFKFEEVNVEDKIMALEKLKWVKYRLKLYGKNFLEINLDSIKSFTDIFVDTNYLLTTEEIIDDKRIKINLVDSISNLYKLAYLTANLPALVNGEKPNVIFMNSILDEVIKHSKSLDPKISKSSQFAYSVLMDMFSEGIVCTEYNGYDSDNDLFLRKLKQPKENVYADGFLLDEIGNYLITQRKSFNYHNKVTKKREKKEKLLEDKNILLITNDKDLITKSETFYSGKKFSVWKVCEMNEIMNKINV
jgi:CheY-like chemotaxis protein